jgi:hypothetical protein
MSNIISKNQWKQITDAVKENALSYNQPSDVICEYSQVSSFFSKSRYSIYDKYDRHESPGLDFVVEKGKDNGSLTVYNCEERAYAPVTFKEGMQIARNFWNEYGSQMAEEIVCEYVMDDNPRISLWK